MSLVMSFAPKVKHFLHILIYFGFYELYLHQDALPLLRYKMVIMVKTLKCVI